MDKIVLQCERISFVHSMQPQSDMIRPPSLLHSSALAASLVGKAPYVYCYPHASALEAKLSLSRYIHLDSRRSIEIDIHSGWNEISTGELRIRSSSAGLRLHIAEAMLVDGSVEIKEQFRSGTMCFERLPAGSSVKFRVPYSFDSELSELSLKVEVSYTTEKGQFVCQSNPSVPITLPLGVNVQDGFKEHALFSKFIISTVTSAPLRMVRSTLQGSEIFKTKPAGSTAGALDVFRSQPASLIYKIDKRKTLAPSAAIGNKSQTSLSLVIDYRCVDEEISTLVEAKFLTAIQGSSYKDFSRLLLPALLDRVKSRSTINELERATLLREIDLGPFEEMLWAQTLIWLRPVTREKVEGWLRSWHKVGHIQATSRPTS